MSDLRKPFFDYSMRRMSYGMSDDEAPSKGAAWHFAEWALEFMSDSTPERAFDAYVRART